MAHLPRHQCLVYSGPPSVQLPALAAEIARRLQANWRCLYLNSPAMVAGIRSALAALGIDVEQQVRERRLMLSAETSHLQDGRFEPDLMLAQLDAEIAKALAEGYVGLWASGDMAWEFGPERDFSKLVAYERGLEKLFHRCPALSGVCQYHADSLPAEAVAQGRALHSAEFVSETLSRLNPHAAPGA